MMMTDRIVAIVIPAEPPVPPPGLGYIYMSRNYHRGQGSGLAHELVWKD